MELLKVMFPIKNKQPQFRFPNWGYSKKKLNCNFIF